MLGKGRFGKVDQIEPKIIPHTQELVVTGATVYSTDIKPTIVEVSYTIAPS